MAWRDPISAAAGTALRAFCPPYIGFKPVANSRLEKRHWVCFLLSDLLHAVYVGTINSPRGSQGMHMKVDHSQFQIDGDRLIHQPTGAVFWMGNKGIVNCDWGQIELASGHDY